jgi:outer membrane protein assembly factor BamE (lipoprotein component of BamABCDE complex)
MDRKTPTAWRWLSGFALSLSLLLGACDQERIAKLEEGVSTEADVRTQFGPPLTERINADGSKRLEYSRQPAGHRNYFIDIAADGKMSALRQVLQPKYFAQVQPGMSALAVRDLLGQPASVVPYALSGETHHNWRFLPDGGPDQTQVFTAVMDRDGKVVKTATGPDTKEASPN